LIIFLYRVFGLLVTSTENYIIFVNILLLIKSRSFAVINYVSSSIEKPKAIVINLEKSLVHILAAPSAIFQIHVTKRPDTKY